jgi:hypothetical protein
VGKPHYAVFELAEPHQFANDSHLTVMLEQLRGSSHTLGAFRLSATRATGSELSALPQDIETALSVLAGTGKFQAVKIDRLKILTLLQRGEIDKPKQVVSPGALSILDPLLVRFSLVSIAEPEK